MATTHPEVARFWHPVKNKKLTPYDVTYGAGKRVWWICDENHEFEREVHTWFKHEKVMGCPFCSGRYATRETNLAFVNPKIASEWHPTKNEDLTPYDVTSGSEKKVCWKCKKGHGVEFKC
ncbi:zinc-ribbon domain-containing protein [Peribacillus sp. NPDC097206]|uniref:zinc-ribbon domain-containing protein n=1 Tax=unclassified Peribacillus TaxID=2675266 RepID=UPI003810C97E